MPNHVYSTLSIGNEITEERQEILNAIEKSGGICRYYKPMPSELEGTTSPQRVGDTENCTITESKSAELKHKYRHDNWYDWCYENWGTKWGCYDFEIEDGTITYTTAWSPVNELILKKMSQDFPDIILSFEEETGWGGEILISNGDIMEATLYDEPDWSDDVVDVDIMVKDDSPSKLSIQLTHLDQEHPNHDNGIGWYMDYSLEFAGKTLEEAKNYCHEGYIKDAE
jgi:hypothetical protein